MATEYVLCPECDGSDEGCWRCAPHYPGLVPVTPGDQPEVVVVVHGE